MKKIIFFLAIGFFNLNFSQEPLVSKNSNSKSISYSNSQHGVQKVAISNKDVRSDLYQYMAWTEPVVIRKDYDLFRIVLHSKLRGIASLSWAINNDYLTKCGLYIERDGLKLHEITLYDDGNYGDGKAGDGLFSCDRLFLQGEPVSINMHYTDNIGSVIDLLPNGYDIKVKYADGHQGIISQNQLLDYCSLDIMLLNPSINHIPKIRQLSDSVYASDYVASIIVPVDTTKIINRTGWPDFQAVSKSFYKYFNDDIDFFFFAFKPLWPIRVDFIHAYSWGGNIKNDIKGIGTPNFDYSSYWGSNRLQYIIPSAGGGFDNIGVYTHEILHRWINIISATLGITEGGHHWGFIQRNTTGFGGLVPYNGVADTIFRKDDSTFCRGDAKGGSSTLLCNDLELYIMGLKEIDSVKFPVITLNKGTPINNEDYCYKADSLRMISKDEFLSILGNREPSVKQSQRQFRFSNIMVSTRKPFVSEISYYDQSLRLYELPKGPTTLDGKLGMTFEEATGGRATMGTKLTPKFVTEQNYLPVAIKPILRKILSINTPNMDISMDSIFIDPNGDILKYEAFTSDSTISSVNILGNILSLQPVNYGSVTCVIEANDGHGGATEIAFVIEVSNTAPIANAGNDQSVNEGATVTLDGSTSSDPDKDNLIYSWSTPSTVLLSDSESSKPTFVAPEVNKDSVFSFSLKVNDGKVSSSPATVKITVQNVIKVGNSETPTPAFMVYPNPTTGMLTLEFTQNYEKKTEVSVSNLVGAEVFRKELNDATRLQIDLSNQVSGIYLLKVIVDNQQYISKIVIRKD